MNEVAIPEAAAPTGGPTLEVVLGTRWSPVQGYKRTRAFAACLQEETGRPVSIVQRSAYAETNAIIAAGRGEVALICSGATADSRLRTTMVPVFRLDREGDGMYRSLIVTRTDDPVVDLAGLRGVSVAWTDPDSLTGYRAPRAAIRALGSEPDALFSSVSFTHSHDASIDAVTQGIVRAAAVDEEVYRTRAPAALKVVWRSEAFPSPPLLVRAGETGLTRALGALANRPECLADLGATRLVPADWSTYDVLTPTIANGR